MEYRSSPYPRFHMTDYHRITLVVYNLLINGILTLSLNLFIVIGLIKTQQVGKNKSIQLVLFLSISDIVGAISVSSLVTVILTACKDHVNETLELVTMFLLAFCAHVSCFIVVLISYDRYVCVRFTTSRNTKLSTKKFNRIIGALLIVSFLDGTISVISTIYKFTTIASSIILTIDFLVFVFAIRCYIAFTKTMTKKAKVSQSGQNSITKDQYLAGIAKRILFTMLIVAFIYLTSIIVNLLFHKNASTLWKGHLEFTLIAGVFAIHTNGAINAAIFIYGNKKLKDYFLYGLLRWKGDSIENTFEDNARPTSSTQTIVSSL